MALLRPFFLVTLTVSFPSMFTLKNMELPFHNIEVKKNSASGIIKRNRKTGREIITVATKTQSPFI